MAVSLSVERNKNQYKPQPLQGLFLFLFHFSLLLSFVLRKYGLRGSEQLGNGRGSGINAGTETGPVVEINDGETPIGAHDGIASIDGNACGLAGLLGSGLQGLCIKGVAVRRAIVDL